MNKGSAVNINFIAPTEEPLIVVVGENLQQCNLNCRYSILSLCQLFVFSGHNPCKWLIPSSSSEHIGLFKH